MLVIESQLAHLAWIAVFLTACIVTTGYGICRSIHYGSQRIADAITSASTTINATLRQRS